MGRLTGAGSHRAMHAEELGRYPGDPLRAAIISGCFRKITLIMTGEGLNPRGWRSV